MTPNGRRAWRRWAKKRLDIVDGFVSNMWMRYWNKWRRHRKSINQQRTVGLLPPKPFTTRSLVGMTMGARKRIAGDIAMKKAFTDYRAGIIAEVFPGQIGEYERAEYKVYRLGQKLRPCHCTPFTGNICDGSGVMPARKAKHETKRSLLSSNI